MNRRRRIKRRTPIYGGKKIQVNFAPIVVIICLSICAGYLTAKYVVYPILGYEPAGLSILQKETKDAEQDEKKETAETSQVTTETSAPQKETAAEKVATTAATTAASPSTKVVEDQVDVKQTAGYALQFGSYSTKAAAQKSVEQLKSSGIEAKIMEKDGAFKVVGELFQTKEQAKGALNKMDDSVGAFVTTIE